VAQREGLKPDDVPGAQGHDVVPIPVLLCTQGPRSMACQQTVKLGKTCGTGGLPIPDPGMSRVSSSYLPGSVSSPAVQTQARGAYT
jgi:hypothetical protein